MQSPPLISVVIPCYNEEEVIERTHKELSTFINSQPGYQWEIIYVDDGSRDKTASLLKQICAKDNKTKCIIFSRNFGHQCAVSAGIDAAIGDAVVLIDADLQDPPKVIADMVQKWSEGFEVVYGVRSEREGESAFKRMTAKVFYRLINRMSDVAIPLDTGDFRIMDRKVVDVLKNMPEKDRFIRGIVSWIGFNQAPIFYKREKRVAGVSKYPLFKMMKFAVDGILSFSRTPLKLATILGFITSLIAVVGIFYAIFLRIFTSEWVTGWTLMFVSILFFGGVQLICLGIIGEYIGRIYGESKNRPLYIIREKQGF